MLAVRSDEARGRRASGAVVEKAFLEQLLRQLHAADALEVALHGGRLLALALGGRLFVELAGTQVGQQAELFDGALEAAKSDVERLVFLDANGGHADLAVF